MRNIKQYLFGLLIFSSLCVFAEEAVEERFPVPTAQEIKEAEKEVETFGKNEVFSLSCKRFVHFLWDRFKRGKSKNFHYRGANPEEVRVCPDTSKPAIILIHSFKSNQGMWIPLLETIQKDKSRSFTVNGYLHTLSLGPVFTFNYEPGEGQSRLIETIEKVKELYRGEDVELCLVGHSLGAINAAEYAFDQSRWVEGTSVKTVISIAGRLKNLEDPKETPLYPACYDVLERVDRVWEKIVQNGAEGPRLCMIAAGDDWLVPRDSVLVLEDEENSLVVPGKGHVMIPFSTVTREKTVDWLWEDIDVEHVCSDFLPLKIPGPNLNPCPPCR